MLTEPDERVRLESRRHGIVLARPLGRALALGAMGAYLLARGWPVSPVGAAALALGAVVAVRAVWRWERTRVVVTTQKLFVVHGTLRRQAAAVRLARIGAVEVEQSLAGRLLGYGTVVAGELEIPHVADPVGVARLLA
jgi:membrane protein YdbS with pleckstrin-like domain